MNKTIMGPMLAGLGLVAGLSGAHAMTTTTAVRHDVAVSRSAPNHDAATRQAPLALLSTKLLHCTAGGACA